MPLFSALNISASGLTAQRLRMDVTSANLANAQSTRTPEGGPYRRQDVVLQESSGDGSFAGALSGVLGGGEPAGVEAAAIVPDTTPLRQVYEPGNPEADARGYVEMPNVQPGRRNDRPDRRLALLPGQRDRDADDQASVLENDRTALMTLPISAVSKAAESR